MDNELEWIYRLAVALAIGGLIGLERGWKGREAEEGDRVLGLRTLGLIGLTGGLAGLLGESLGPVLIGLILIGLSILLGVGYAAAARANRDIGLTSEVAALVAFLLATLAGLGYLAIASAGGVVTAILLRYKDLLHGGLRALTSSEIEAAFKLLLMSVVLLPLLPNQGYGPWQALNPYVIWWMVVLIATLSFVGYFAIRIAGAQAGIILTAFFGGLASSTATTLNLARLARKSKVGSPLLSGGILLACGTMFPRMLLVATLIQPQAFMLLVWPVLTLSVISYAVAAWYLRKRHGVVKSADLLPANPLELTSALSFGTLLTSVMFLGQALTEWLGEAGILILAAASGVADVDAITLSLARMSQEDLGLNLAVLGMIIAAAVNTLVKACMAVFIGGHEIGLRVAVPLLFAVVAGGGVAAMVAWPPG